MAKNSAGTPASTASGAGGNIDIEQIVAQRTAAIDSLQTERTSVVGRLSQIDGALAAFGITNDAAAPARRGRRAGSRNGQSGKRGAQDPYRLRGRVLQVMAASGSAMNKEAVTAAVLKTGFRETPTLGGAIGVQFGKLLAEKLLSKAERGSYQITSAGRKVLAQIEADIKARAAKSAA